MDLWADPSLDLAHLAAVGRPNPRALGAIRGVEEARACAVLVGQCRLWLIPVFPFSFVAPGFPVVPFAANMALAAATVALPIGLPAWATLALIRGCKEHREHLAMLRAPPGAES